MDAETIAAHLPVVTRACRAQLRNQRATFADAEDAAQNTMTSLLAARARGREFPTTPAYLVGAGTRQALSLARAIRRDWEPRELGELPDVPAKTGDPARAAAARADLRRLLAHLPAADRRLLWLRIGLEWSAREVADELGTTAGAVRVAQHRVLQRARQLASGRPRRTGGGSR